MKTNLTFNPDIHFFYSELEQRLLSKSSADILDIMREYSHCLHNGLGEIHIFALQIIHPHSHNDIIIEASRGLKDYVCSNKIARNNGIVGAEEGKIEFKYANNDVT